MGNIIAAAATRSKKKAKIIKLDGGTVTVKTPATAADVLKELSDNHVLLERESVKKFGVRAPKLKRWEELKPDKSYFLVEMPKFPVTGWGEEWNDGFIKQDLETGSGSGSGSLRVKVRIPRAQIEKANEESKDEAQVAEKIVHLCLEAASQDRN